MATDKKKKGSGGKKKKPALQIVKDDTTTDTPPGEAADATVSSSTTTDAEDTEGEETKSEPSMAVRLIRLINPETLVADDRGDGYVHLQMDDHRQLLRLRGRAFRAHLAERMYDTMERVPSGEAISSAIGVLEAKARRRPRVTLWNRVARGPDGAIWLDLVDSKWRAVRVTSLGWQVIAQPPPLFRRFAHQAPLPLPVSGGRLDRLLDYLNLEGRQDEILFLCSTVAAVVPDIPQGILLLHGPQGSAKTTAGRVRRDLVDPSAAPTVIIKRDIGEVVQALDHHYMPLLDNLNGLPDWMSDILCQAATGGGFVKRELYSDSDDVLYVFRRPLILTGVNVPATAPDLLDRSLLIRLNRISPEARRDELSFLRSFEAERPRLVGALLDALVGAMRAYHQVTYERLPRLADFARWGAAAAEHLGYGAKAFFDAIDSNVARQVDEVVEGDTVAQAVVAFAVTVKEWTGTPTELLDALNKPRKGMAADPGWPRQPNVLSRRLNMLAPALVDRGVKAEQAPVGTGNDKQRGWHLQWLR